MKKENGTSKKDCENCSWFMRHFAKGSSSYIPVNCGHCRNSDNKKKKAVLCEHWEDEAKRKEERRESIKDVINSMSRQLTEILQLLQEDDETEE